MTIAQFRDMLLDINGNENLMAISFSIDRDGVRRYRVITDENEHIIKVGEWINIGYECSVCGEKNNEMLDYCPCCGAFMK